MRTQSKRLSGLSRKIRITLRQYGFDSIWVQLLLIAFFLQIAPISFADELLKKQVKEDFYAIKGIEHYQELKFEFKDRFENDWQIAGFHWSVNADKIAVLVHGYADNCGYLKPLQTWFLRRQWDVICLELPGHGRSSGKRADIPDMLVYEDMYINIFPKLNQYPYNKLVFYGHSTGNVGMIEHLLNQRKHPFDTIIMATPLVRSNHWQISRIGNFLFGGLFDTVPRRNIAEKNSDYQTLRELDPNQIDQVPLHWFDQLLKWNATLESDNRLSQEPIAVIFAGDDSVIDTEYNKKFLKQHFRKARFYFIPDAEHILHYNEDKALQRFYQLLEDILVETE